MLSVVGEANKLTVRVLSLVSYVNVLFILAVHSVPNTGNAMLFVVFFSCFLDKIESTQRST